MTRTSPPRARLAFRVGVVGHRPDRLGQADHAVLSQRVHDVLRAVKVTLSTFASTSDDAALYQDDEPIVRALSPLAEGTDRLFADVALTLGYQLCCPMPFAQSTYEQDFLPPHAWEPASRDRFRALLRRAADGPGLVTFQLDGDRRRAGEAYGAAGRVVLNQSDLLIVVWDGGKPAGGGGTVQTLTEAMHFHVPVLWIDAVTPHTWRVLRSEADLSCLATDERCVPAAGSEARGPDALDQVVADIVTGEIGLTRRTPETAADLIPPARAREYFAARKPRVNAAFVWKLFRNAVGSTRLAFPSLAVPDFETRVQQEWPSAPQHQGHRNETAPEWVNRKLRPHFAWADQLADLHADAYRSAYVLAFLLSAFAVFLALLPMAAGWTTGAHALQVMCIAAELMTLLAIIGLFFWARRGRWHERWLEYRLLAELIREVRIFVPLGGGRPLPHVPAHFAVYGDPTQTWMYWQMRAVARATGIPNVAATSAHARDCLDYLDRVVRDPRTGQSQFHGSNATRSGAIAHRLHVLTLVLLWSTVGCVCLHLMQEASLPLIPAIQLPPWLDRWLLLAGATFPAAGAALTGIANQGEFARVAKRSGAMAAQFVRFGDQIDELRLQQDGGSAELTLADVVPLALRIATVMVDEVVDWRVVFIDRPPTTP